MRIALVDSGVGLLPAAAALRRARPDAGLVLSCDPDGMPWGPRSPEGITARALRCARAAAAERPDAVVVACNTATVHALPALRAALEPGVPVIGTVPAVKPAAASGGPFAIWATPATTGSAYQRRLIGEFAPDGRVAEVPCHGLADAVERADEAAIAAAVKAAAELTPPETTAIVLGCTHYELVAARIRAHLLSVTGVAVTLFGSAEAVAAQVLRRTGRPAAPDTADRGGLTVFASGRPAALPPAALAYAEGRFLAPSARRADPPAAGSRGGTA
ncbi:aspartate/glutamate racemase family protein [Streptomyces sp. MP131-18]|uniref:glutamate racemase n=1 Tax=Streptomyces sp. MP131-18 TaxID=1857892 RepID=UPI00097BCC9E|nr:aspartate/glutamate racemase family protein [Streptomyces sp. MP131-18]ONK15793.1 Glutamate racemase [Streptomyces sp. MP131-18]